jgi:hypothetical protein
MLAIVMYCVLLLMSEEAYLIECPVRELVLSYHGTLIPVQIGSRYFVRPIVHLRAMLA